MRLTYYLVLVALFLCSVNSSAQTETQDTTIFPYILPIWGQKVHERGMADRS